jgi:hypothetical protein
LASIELTLLEPDENGANWSRQEGIATETVLTDTRTSMPSPEAASRVVGRLFRADGDHITDLKIPLSTRPVDVVLWYSRVFQYKGTEASGQPVYFEASAYAVPEAA